MKYELIIDENLMVEEKIYAFENISFLDDLDNELMVDQLINQYQARYVGHGFEEFKEDELFYVVAKRRTPLNELNSQPSIFELDEFNVVVTPNQNSVNINITTVPDVLESYVFPYRTYNLQIDIKSKLEVLDHNADRSRFGTYTWEIEPGDQARTISITIDKERLANTLYILGIGIPYSAFIFFGVVAVIGFVAWSLIKKHNEENNKL